MNETRVGLDVGLFPLTSEQLPSVIGDQQTTSSDDEERATLEPGAEDTRGSRDMRQHWQCKIDCRQMS